MKNFGKIMEIAGGFWKSQALLVACEYDIFTYLSPKGNTLDNLYKASSTNKEALARLLNTLVALNLLKKKNDYYFNTPIVEKFLVKNKKNYRGEILRHYQDLWNSWNNLSLVVKSGFSEDFLNDKKFIKNIEKRKAFLYGLNDVGFESAKCVAQKLPLKNVKKVLDLGGGGGIFSQGIVSQNPKIKCTIFDLPEILEITKEIIKGNHAIDTCAGNFNTDPLPTGFDLILLSKVTHIENKENNIKLFKKCFKSLNPDGKIAIHDFMFSTDHSEPAFSALFDLNMLVRTPRGGVYSKEEYQEWLKEADFGKFKIYAIPRQTNLLIGTKL